MRSREKGSALTRREFVALVASGSAAVLASPLSAATTARPAARRPAAATMLSEADRKELERQRKSTAETLATLRNHKMGPGTELASVFLPLKSSRRSG